MDEFKFYIDRKLTTWDREFVSIEAENIEEAKKQIIEIVENGDYFDDSYVETIYETIEYLSPKDNSGMPTIEVYENDDDELIWDNGNKN